MDKQIHLKVERFVSLAQKKNYGAIRMKVTSLTGDATISFCPYARSYVRMKISKLRKKIFGYQFCYKKTA